jgi:hypothetical protein
MGRVAGSLLLAFVLASCSKAGPSAVDPCSFCEDDLPGDSWQETDDGANRDAPPADDVPSVPDAIPELPVDIFDTGAPDDGPPPPLWDDLVGTGEPVGRIVGVASHMSNTVDPNPLRDFEFDSYVDFQQFKIRRGLRWNHVEPSQDVWNFDRVRTPVVLSQEHNVRILPMLAYGNAWAQDDPDVYGTLHVADYADYAGHMAAEFCALAKDYELWNEENLTRFWHIAPDPAKYADMVIASAVAIRAACPDARVVFGGMASYDDVDLFNTWGFLRLALAARPELCASFDALALHPYTWFQFDPPEHDEQVSFDVTKPSQTRMTTIAREILAAAGCAPKPILFTEVGWPTYELSEDQVARFAARSLLLSARDGVEGWYWYTFWDDAPDAAGIRPHENHFGLWGWPGADDSVRRPKPAWNAVKTAGMLLRGYRFARDLGTALGLPNDVYVLAFVDEAGRIALALWDGREMPDVTLDGDETGGPDTTYALTLPLPACTTATHLVDMNGAPQEAPPAGATASLVLTPRVQYLTIDCDPVRPAARRTSGK